MSALDRLGGNVVKRDDGGAINVQDLDSKQLLLALLLEMQLLTTMVKEISGLELEPRDVNIRDASL